MRVRRATAKSLRGQLRRIASRAIASSAPSRAKGHSTPGAASGGGPAREPPAPSGDEGKACTAPVDLHEGWAGRARCNDARVGRRIPSGVARDALAAGLAGAACSALPSTAWALLRGDDVLEGARAVGVMVLPHERRTPVLLITAGTVHLGISLAWSAVIAAVLPRRAEPAWGVAGALAIAALDLAVIGRRIPAIRALPQGRQWADHVAYGLTVGLVLRARRSG